IAVLAGDGDLRVARDDFDPGDLLDGELLEEGVPALAGRVAFEAFRPAGPHGPGRDGKDDGDDPEDDDLFLAHGMKWVGWGFGSAGAGGGAALQEEAESDEDHEGGHGGDVQQPRLAGELVLLPL